MAKCRHHNYLSLSVDMFIADLQNCNKAWCIADFAPGSAASHFSPSRAHLSGINSHTKEMYIQALQQNVAGAAPCAYIFGTWPVIRKHDVIHKTGST